MGPQEISGIIFTLPRASPIPEGGLEIKLLLHFIILPNVS